MSVHLVIKTVGADSAEVPVDIDTSATVAELKEQIAGRVGMPASHIRLVCAGRIWQDVATIASYEPSDGNTVHCLNNPPRAAPAATEQIVSEPNPMQAMMGGMPAVNANSNDPMEQMMAQSQQMLMNNPEMMQQIMNSPMVQQMMSNPETVRSMMRMNPRLNQLMEQRPEIARMLEDPEVLQQSMRLATNPSLMREMQRNADRAIGQLDAMPGGHNALVRAHEEIADPLFAAFSGGADGGAAEINTYSQSTEGGPNNEALPNPWGAPAPTPAPAASPSPAATPAPAANPMMGMMGMPPMGGAQATNPLLASMLAPGGQTGAPAGNQAGGDPMAAMMQQMMSNPAMMQQSMAMAQQMFGQGAGGPAVGAAATTPGISAPNAPAPTTQPPATSTPAAQPVPPVNPFAAMFGGQPMAAPQAGANPFAAMMQQMMNNPAMMQQPMGFGGAGFPGATETPAPAAPGAAPVATSFQRAQFAAQLAQLSAMGFANEEACLRALIQHQGRVDAAIDSLLSSGEGAA